MKNKSLSQLLSIVLLSSRLALWADAADPSKKMGFEHMGAEFGAYEVDPSGGIKLGGVKQGGNRLGYPLGGTWQLALDPEKKGVKQEWFKALPGIQTITLPGTLDEAGIGTPGKPTVYYLTRKHEYIGAAWYQREIVIPETWKGKTVQLWLDRVMWESRLYVDGLLIGSEDSLCTPHTYELGILAPGRHRLTLRIDNSERPGANCHGYGDELQIKWNGVVGRMELIGQDPVHLASARTIPDFAGKRVRVLLTLANDTGVTTRGQVRLKARLHKSPDLVGSAEGYFTVAGKRSLVELAVPLDKNWRPWSEFDPALYDLTVSIVSEADGASFRDESTLRFGVRTFGHDGTQFTMNGKTLYLRGTHDGIGFPLLGHPAGDVQSWLRIFRICKDYGLNHVRYHSVCPNTPAFVAADEEGILLHAELPIWTAIKQEGAGQAFLQREIDRILEFYGNNPSFGMFSMGNEHAGDWDFLGRMVERAKRLDPTRQYVASSNEYIRPGEHGIPVNPNDDYAVIMFGAEKNHKRPRIRYMERMTPDNEDFHRDADYRDILEGFKIPVIAHELGQWWIYPDFKEIEKYTGVLEAKNFEIFRDSVKAGGMLGQNEELHMVSGKLAMELYKEDIERELRTPKLGGFQLLDLHDYSGQGTALVGILDAFWDSKGLITPAEFREFCAPTVILARIPQQVYEEGQTILVPMEVCHYGAQILENTAIEWSFAGQDGKVLAQGSTQPRAIPQGGNTVVGDAVLPVLAGPARQITLTARMAKNGVVNHWKVWTYPKVPMPAQGAEKVVVVDRLDDQLLKQIAKGGRVLVIADNLDCQVPAYFSNPVWTPHNFETAGLLIQANHGAFADFPTSSYSDFQWHNFLRPGRAFILHDLPPFKPVAQAIEAPSLLRNYRLATVVAARCGAGAVVLTSLNLRDPRPEARQLRQSCVNYLARGQFAQDPMLSQGDLKTLVQNPRFTTVAHPEGKPVLKVNPALKTTQQGFTKWTPEVDEVVARSDGFGYRFESDNARWGVHAPADMVMARGTAKAWSLFGSSLIVTCPKGFAGSIYLNFQDPENSEKRDGFVFGFGGAFMSGRETKADRWAAIRVRPEDSQSGELKLRFRKTAYGDSWSTSPLVTGLVVVE